MKIHGSITSVSGKISRNGKNYILLGMSCGKNVFCWDKQKLEGYKIGDEVEISASDEEFSKLLSISKIPQQQEVQKFFTPPAAPSQTTTRPAASAAPASDTAEILQRIANIENHLMQSDEKFMELFLQIRENAAQNAATIQSTAGQVAAIKQDTEALIGYHSPPRDLDAETEED